MCAMLEKYRVENQKIVSQKDREMEALGDRLKESEQHKVALHCSTAFRVLHFCDLCCAESPEHISICIIVIGDLQIVL